jgi:hypothetical protein
MHSFAKSCIVSNNMYMYETAGIAYAVRRLATGWSTEGSEFESW